MWMDNSMLKLLRKIKRKSMLALDDIRFPRYSKVRRLGRGLLTARIYKAIYESAKNAEDGDIVDIGAAGGATTVSLALALKEKGSAARVIAVEKCEGGSRTQYGNYSDNKEFLESNLHGFSVQDHAVIFPHYLTEHNAADLFQMIRVKPLAGFVHDADGHIHRDFAILGPHLAKTNNFVIVDDYANTRKYRPISEKYPQGGAKEQITYRLLNYLTSIGLFAREFAIGTTQFGHVPESADFSQLDMEHCSAIIQSVIEERDTVTS